MSDTNEDGFSPILWQLQQYQMVIRKWDRYLDPYEYKVLMQLLDRTTGWQKDRATFRTSVILNGDKMYTGLGETMHRSKLMKVLRRLEGRGFILRRVDSRKPHLKSYQVNLGWTPELEAELRELCDESVADGDGIVSHADTLVSPGDFDVSDGDPRETYRDDTILTGNQENVIGAAPRPSASAHRAIRENEGSSGETEPRTGRARMINPPLRRRPA